MPVFVVPGNHERSRIPHLRHVRRNGIHLFDRPRTHALQCGGTRVALSGFPYERRHVRTRFPQLLESTRWRDVEADVRILCFHHCVEGATVGPANYTFRRAPGVIRTADLPADFAAVLSGHIHRHQVLEYGLDGRRLPTPVFYPGSVERTSIAEVEEVKGYVVLECDGTSGVTDWHFEPLSTRPLLPRTRREPSPRPRPQLTLWDHPS